MNGARWGWLALIGSMAVLFAASSQESAHHGKLVASLRTDLEKVTRERDQVLNERNDARELASETNEWATLVHTGLAAADQEVRQLRAEREALRQEIAKLSLDRGQLQQTVLSLQQERTQTKQNLEQLRHGLQQLLSQTEAVTSTLAAPAPGLMQITVVETKKVSLPEAPIEQYEDVPLNRKQ